MDLTQSKKRLLVGTSALAWNLFGVFQFFESLKSTKESLMSMGLTQAQVQVMAALPGWMDWAFGIGTLGGTLGCILLLLKSPWAQPTLLVSLLAYVVLYIGDITEGVFAALGAPQVIILTTVVLIALALFIFSKKNLKKVLVS